MEKISNTETSMWGEGDKATYDLLLKESITGKWLNLAAGDGRYNDILLEKADQVIAVDKDGDVLEQLISRTAEQYRAKLDTSFIDIEQRFPFEDNSFDGIFCTGTLHLFSRDMLKKIFKEVYRILKRDGKIIFDFATDVERLLPTGELHEFSDQSTYTMEQVKELLNSISDEFTLQIIESKVPEERITLEDVSYRFQCKFILVVAHVKK